LFFLTSADTERLNIRGSRDPLGLVPIWGDFGRKVVGNLTTASNSARGFTTLLLGLYFAERVCAGKSDQAAEKLAAFLKFEQLVGFARVLRNNDEAIRGITEINRRLDEGNGRRFRIGSSADLQILSNQKTYGIWGLFIMPAIESGLVVQKDIILTPVARDLVEKDYLPILRRRGKDEATTVEALLNKSSFEAEPEGRHKILFDSLGDLMAPQFRHREREVFHFHLIHGGENGTRTGWQPRFAEVMESTLPTPGEYTYESMAAMINATRSVNDQPLREHLVKIRDLEALLVIIDNLFAFLQNRDNARVTSIVSELKKEWGAGLRHLRCDSISEMQSDLARVFSDASTGERVVSLAAALYEGSYEGSIDLVLAHNKFVMASRKGSQAWIQRSGDKIEVRYKEGAQKRLLPPRELATTWRSTFYINPLKTVSDQIRRRTG
jgi:hypothetical protein